MSDEISPFSRIADVDELTDGLALIIVTGPSYRGRRALDRVREHLDSGRPVIWHRLDRDGPDIAAAIDAAGSARPIVLAYGLEYLFASERRTLTAQLNLLRDRLGDMRATLILWVSRDEIAEFQRYRADLFQWRSLLIDLGPEDVPVEQHVVNMLRYLGLRRSGRVGTPRL